jgi:NAD(P)-dependent dehydrogenase (short-subunit alcohol dehydrogenase family)
LKSTGSTVSSGIYDASKAAEAQRLVKEVVDTFSRLDIMVNNAGAIKPQPFLEVTEEVWDWSMDLNLKGVYFHMQEAAKFMIKQGSGTIINIASVAGIAGGMTLSPPYAASKAAIINLTKVAAAKMAEHGITVNSVAPGIVDTAFNWTIDSEIGVDQLNMKPGEQLAERAAPVPLGRISQPEDVSNVVAFLASPDASYITGETIVVSGGLVMR